MEKNTQIDFFALDQDQTIIDMISLKFSSHEEHEEHKEHERKRNLLFVVLAIYDGWIWSYYFQSVLGIKTDILLDVKELVDIKGN